MTVPKGRALTIGFAVAGGLVAIALVLIPSSHSTRRSPVYRYIGAVDAVEAEMTPSLSQVQSAYRAVTVTHSTTPATAARFAAAERTLRRLSSRLGALDAPAEASALRALLLRLVREETDATHEVGALVLFVPRFDAVLAELRAAAATLAHRLAASAGPTPHALHGTPAQIKRAQAAFAAQANRAAAAQADAVVAYGAVVARAIGQLSALSPPAVMEPQYRYQLVSLRRTAAAGARLAAALRAAVRTNIAQLSRDFTVATRASQSVAEQRAEIAAVRSYDARFRVIAATQAAIGREVARLQSRQH